MPGTPARPALRSVLARSCADNHASLDRLNGRPYNGRVTTKTIVGTVNGSAGAKAIPGATVVTTIVVRNPDVVPPDPDTVTVALPVPSGMAPDIAAADAVKLTQGDGISLVYANATSTSDDVDFACGDANWTCTPTSPQVVTYIRSGLKGSLKAGEILTVTVTYRII